jgi:hypothetical protein
VKNYLDILSEGILTEYRVEADGIFSGPTAQQMADLAAREDYRGVAYGDKVYLGRAYEWTHNAMAMTLGLPDDEWEPFFVSTLDRAMADDRGDEWLEGVFNPDQLSVRHPLGFIVINAFPNNAQFARMARGYETERGHSTPTPVEELDEAVVDLAIRIEGQQIIASLAGKDVAWYVIDSDRAPEGCVCLHANVDDASRRIGVSSQVYDWAERHFATKGLRLCPYELLSPEAYEMWKKRDPDAVEGYFRDGRNYYSPTSPLAQVKARLQRQ